MPPQKPYCAAAISSKLHGNGDVLKKRTQKVSGVSVCFYENAAGYRHAKKCLRVKRGAHWSPASIGCGLRQNKTERGVRCLENRAKSRLLNRLFGIGLLACGILCFLIMTAIRLSEQANTEKNADPLFNEPWQTRYVWEMPDNGQEVVSKAAGITDLEKVPDEVVRAVQTAFADVGTDVRQMRYIYYYYNNRLTVPASEDEWCLLFSSDPETTGTLYCAHIGAESRDVKYLYEATGKAAFFAVHNGIRQSVFSSTLAPAPTPVKMYLKSGTIRTFHALPCLTADERSRLEICDREASTGAVIRVQYYSETADGACLQTADAQTAYVRDEVQRWTDAHTGRDVKVDAFSLEVETEGEYTELDK